MKETKKIGKMSGEKGIVLFVSRVYRTNSIDYKRGKCSSVTQKSEKVFDIVR
jgi:hypothetical protein